jgi:hypothetical protein
MRTFVTPVLAAALTMSTALAQTARFEGELSAEQILDGEYPFPPSPAVDVPLNLDGLDRARLGQVPPPGVHPRILFSPDQLPDLRQRVRNTNVGRALYATLQTRLDQSLRDPKYWGSELYRLLAAGDTEGAARLIEEKGAMPPDIGHYQPFLQAVVLEALDALILEDDTRGRAAATAIAAYAALVRPGIEASRDFPLGEDAWRAAWPPERQGSVLDKLGARDGPGGHLLGYAYDFAFPWMTAPQRDTVRATIAAATAGRIWMGARLPHHFRNWNWIAVGLQKPLLALAIEGEEGYDPRVYRLGVELARDYLTHGISARGVSTEAVGYTQFGLVWANPFFVAAQRRGADLLGHGHHRAMLDWYLHTTVPARDRWLSHGDGGDGGPSLGTAAMWRWFFPSDPKAAAVWRTVTAPDRNALEGKFHLVEALVWAADDPDLGKTPPGDGADLAKLGLPQVMFDPERGSLVARSGWDKDSAFVQFECRTDSVGASHEHADRGMFTFAALGRVWAKDNFRSVETRHHNSILIDGAGQGYWPGPGVWLGLEESGPLLVAACDAKDAYAWFWPKQILAEDPATFPRFAFPRWASYGPQAATFQKVMPDAPGERETRPGVVKFWEGFSRGDPRLWDEDGWPVRYPHNPVQRAFRSIAFERGPNPWLLVVDDIQKDDKERLYEWLMQTGPDTEIVRMKDRDIILGDASLPRGPDGLPRPRKGDRLLLVRVLDLANPAQTRDFHARPSARLETFERRDTVDPGKDGLGGRTFGVDKRLVVASRSVAPDFKILLYPHRQGDPLPETSWNDDRTRLTITTPVGSQTLALSRDAAGRTMVARSNPE